MPFVIVWLMSVTHPPVSEVAGRRHDIQPLQEAARVVRIREVEVLEDHIEDALVGIANRREAQDHRQDRRHRNRNRRRFHIRGGSPNHGATQSTLRPVCAVGAVERDEIFDRALAGAVVDRSVLGQTDLRVAADRADGYAIHRRRGRAPRHRA